MSLFEDFTAAVDQAIATRDSRCPAGRTGRHASHDLADGSTCPGHVPPPLRPADQTSRLADLARQEIRHG